MKRTRFVNILSMIFCIDFAASVLSFADLICYIPKCNSVEWYVYFYLGNGRYLQKWVHASVRVPRVAGSFRIMFEGVVRQVERRTNIAIDDYKISDKECGFRGKRALCH